MKLSEDLAWRGLIKDKTFADISWLDTPRTFYLGIDAASSDSLTIGNLAVLMLARRFIESGWKAVLLAGGATSLVGDPGGKTSERELQSKEKIVANIEAIKKQIERLLGSDTHELVNNIDWLGDVKYLDFLRDTGKYYSMTELMQRDFVSARMGETGSGISYAEFSYSLLQGYDFWWLFKNKGVELQIGASDQWGNMLSGVPLIRKKEGKEAHAMSMPLVINKTTGVKFGKSEEGAIWLDPKKTSENDFHQFWLNVSDEDVDEYLKTFTLLPKNEIETAMIEHLNNPSERLAQKRLADELTKIIHGEHATFVANRYLTMLSVSPSASPSPEVPDDGFEYIKLGSGISLVEALVKTGLTDSNTEARRVIEEKGIYINNEPANKEMLNADDFEGGRLLLRRGKKLQNSVLIELE